MDPLDRIRNVFANPSPMDSHFYVACGSRHESALNDSQSAQIRHPAEEMAPIHPPYISFYGRLYGGSMCNVKP